MTRLTALIIACATLAGCDPAPNTAFGPRITGNDHSVLVTGATAGDAFPLADAYCKARGHSARITTQHDFISGFDCV